ncbi:MAG: FAD:protein FMN transferase [Peptococcaceae bacterium]|nr:FAD:protein FMN transferase [Peptococcaceae bacterium]
MVCSGSNRRIVQSALYMDTVVTLTIATDATPTEVEPALARAFAAFERVQGVCNRFDAQAEISKLALQIGKAIPVSDLLFEAIRFALAVADCSRGAFDPTLGFALQANGFDRNYLTGARLNLSGNSGSTTSYRDVVLDAQHKTVLLTKPLVLDLGAVAKGLAVDIAAQELSDFRGFMIDAGGDIFAGGLNERGEPWRIGVRHPKQKDRIICAIELTDAAVCTSGGYERPSPVKAGTHHLIEPSTGMSPGQVVSSTVIAPFAMLADAFSTTAFILGPDKGIAYLEEVGLEGMLITPALELRVTQEMERFLV